MKTIKESYSHEIMVDKSRFIAILLPLKTFEEAVTLLSEVKKKYPKARHYCYAYRYDERSKCSDDGEPKGSAGRPMLEVLMHHHLSRCLLVVVRYFGGTKLGAGRLLYTYVDSAAKVIACAETYLISLVNIYEVKIDYRQENLLIAGQANQYEIVQKNYHESGVVAILESCENLREKLISLFEGQVTIADLGQKEKLVKEEGKKDE